MDLGFSRRITGGGRTIDLDVLLATIGAVQAAGPTARAQQSLIAQDHMDQHDNPRLALFADCGRNTPVDPRLASFAPAFSVRQPK
jgi:hypothetical protein